MRILDTVRTTWRQLNNENNYSQEDWVVSTFLFFEVINEYMHIEAFDPSILPSIYMSSNKIKT